MKPSDSSSGNPDSPSSSDLGEQLRSARKTGGAFQLQPRLLVRVSGGDAFRYLNGQITRDLSRLSADEAIPACLLTPKGKLCAPLLIRRDAEIPLDLLIEAPLELEEALMARLERYIVADDVTLTLQSSQETIHLFGAFVDGEFAKNSSDIRVTRLGAPGLDLEIDQIGGKKFSPLLDPRVVETLRIERRIPTWGREMNEETLPPEVGLDLTHIEYDRGCYPGQEVMSRLKSIGRVNRLLQRLISNSGAPLHPGMSVQNSEGKELGAISSAAPQFDTGAWVALATLPRTISESRDALFALDPLTGEKTPISIREINGS